MVHLVVVVVGDRVISFEVFVVDKEAGFVVAVDFVNGVVVVVADYDIVVVDHKSVVVVDYFDVSVADGVDYKAVFVVDHETVAVVVEYFYVSEHQSVCSVAGIVVDNIGCHYSTSSQGQSYSYGEES